MKPALAAKHPRCDPGQSFGYSDLSSSIVGMVWSCARPPSSACAPPDRSCGCGGRTTLQEAGSTAHAFAECGCTRGADASTCVYASESASDAAAPCLTQFADIARL